MHCKVMTSLTEITPVLSALFMCLSCAFWASLVAQRLKCLPPMWETRVRSLGRGDPLEKEMVTHFSILAWRIPWTEEPGGLQSTGSPGVGDDWVMCVCVCVCVCVPSACQKRYTSMCRLVSSAEITSTSLPSWGVIRNHDTFWLGNIKR